MPNRKIPTIFRALKAMHNYYLQRGFQIVFVQGDGEFKPLKDLIESELYGGPTMNLTSANEHDPEIERKHEASCHQRTSACNCVQYACQRNSFLGNDSLGDVCCQSINIFPVKGGIPGWSPTQIMTGEVVHYKYYCVPFGSYCKIS